MARADEVVKLAADRWSAVDHPLLKPVPRTGFRTQIDRRLGQGAAAVDPAP
jgi:hypothetical protein